MSMKRTRIYVDVDDLALIKEAAEHRSCSEAEIIREGIHLAALSYRVRDDPDEWPKVSGGGEPVTKEEVRRAVAGWRWA